VERVVIIQTADVGVYPARRRRRVEVDGHTQRIADTIAQTVSECRELVHVNGVDAVLFGETRPRDAHR